MEVMGSERTGDEVELQASGMVNVKKGRRD